MQDLNIKLSIIIVNYNVKYFLNQCLQSVFKSNTNFNFEVIIVDNNSVDGSVNMLKEKFKQVTIIENNENTGFSKANNQGISISKGEFILLLNPDTIIEDDTLSKVVNFMESKPNAGGLGVKMINGEGKFLPESKRGLPTPSVSFYKIIGFSRLFPKSKTFSKYHLGYLDKDKIHEVDILSGAFMLLRKSVLDKIGLLDETFFMYGEDIDLSYRIIKAGYKNFYYPETRIIHYKGESTKKSSVNYVIVFYNAMLIFARKHFSTNNARIISFFIHFAVYIRAFIAIFGRFLQKISLFTLDIASLFGGMFFLKTYWEQNNLLHQVDKYPNEFMLFAVPGYIIIWIVAVFFSGGYDKPIKISKVFRGVLIGSTIILVFYALLPEIYRFSRALIIFGSIWAFISMAFWRFMLHLSGIRHFKMTSKANLRFVVIGENEEAERVSNLIKQTSLNPTFIGLVSVYSGNNYSNNGYLGNFNQLKEIINIYKIDQVIFCAKDISAQQIIDNISQLQDTKVDCKIAPPESLFIIGSNSIETSAELYIINTSSITKTENLRNKRVLDFLVSFFLLISLPINVFYIKNPINFIKNLMLVFIGKISWVGYYNLKEKNKKLPKIKNSVLHPYDILSSKVIDENTAEKLNLIYARDYKISQDIRIIFGNIRNLGR